MPTISKQQLQDYERLKKLESSGHLLDLPCLRLIMRSCDFQPEQVGKHFLEVYYRWKRNGH